MTRLIRGVLFAALCSALSACSQAPMTTTFKTLSPEEALQKMQAEPQALILDVREPMEYDRGHILGAENLPLSVLEKGVPAELTDKQRTLLVYCRSGRRSRMAAEILVKAGFAAVYDFGGIEAWPYPMSR